MMNKILSCMMIMLLLAGCATPRRERVSKQDLDKLQNQINMLQARVRDKDDEILYLKQRLNTMQEQPKSQTVVYAAPESSQKTESKPVFSPVQLQKALKNAGYYSGPIDGKIGKKTKQGILDFQKAHGLKADGIVGKNTWAELKKYLEIK